MEYILIINPVKEQYERYKVVLLLNGGMSKGYPTEMDINTIIKKVEAEVNAYSNGTVKLIYND